MQGKHCAKLHIYPMQYGNHDNYAIWHALACIDGHWNFVDSFFVDQNLESVLSSFPHQHTQTEPNDAYTSLMHEQWQMCEMQLY